MARLALRELCGYRAGDKGDIANVAIFADDDETYARDRRRGHRGAGEGALRRRWCTGRVDRYRADNVRALNFVMHGALGGGGPRTLRADNLGKTLGGALVRLEIDVPDSLAGRRRARPDVAWADAILDARYLGLLRPESATERTNAVSPPGPSMRSTCSNAG